jgi:hypothetical protein
MTLRISTLALFYSSVVTVTATTGILGSGPSTSWRIQSTQQGSDKVRMTTSDRSEKNILTKRRTNENVSSGPWAPGTLFEGLPVVSESPTTVGADVQYQDIEVSTEEGGKGNDNEPTKDDEKNRLELVKGPLGETSPEDGGSNSASEKGNSAETGNDKGPKQNDNSSVEAAGGTSSDTPEETNDNIANDKSKDGPVKDEKVGGEEKNEDNKGKEPEKENDTTSEGENIMPTPAQNNDNNEDAAGVEDVSDDDATGAEDVSNDDAPGAEDVSNDVAPGAEDVSTTGNDGADDVGPDAGADKTNDAQSGKDEAPTEGGGADGPENSGTGGGADSPKNSGTGGGADGPDNSNTDKTGNEDKSENVKDDNKDDAVDDVGDDKGSGGDDESTDGKEDTSNTGNDEKDDDGTMADDDETDDGGDKIISDFPSLAPSFSSRDAAAVSDMPSLSPIAATSDMPSAFVPPKTEPQGMMNKNSDMMNSDSAADAKGTEKQKRSGVKIIRTSSDNTSGNKNSGSSIPIPMSMSMSMNGPISKSASAAKGGNLQQNGINTNKNNNKKSNNINKNNVDTKIDTIDSIAPTSAPQSGNIASNNNKNNPKMNQVPMKNNAMKPIDNKKKDDNTQTVATTKNGKNNQVNGNLKVVNVNDKPHNNKNTKIEDTNKKTQPAGTHEGNSVEAVNISDEKQPKQQQVHKDEIVYVTKGTNNNKFVRRRR